jgi:Helix-turn-helix domain
MATITKPQLLDNREAADFIGITPKTLETWRSGKRYSISYTKVGGKVYYFAEDLLAWLESRRVTV